MSKQQPDWLRRLEQDAFEHHRDIEAAANIGEFLESLEWWHESLLSTAEAVGKGDPIAAALEADTTCIAKRVLREARKASRHLKINIDTALPRNRDVSLSEICNRFDDLIRQVGDYATAEIEDELTHQEQLIFRCLLKSKHFVSFNTIGAISDAFRDSRPTDRAIETALKRLREKLDSLPESGFILDIQKANRRVKLIPPKPARN